MSQEGDSRPLTPVIGRCALDSMLRAFECVEQISAEPVVAPHECIICFSDDATSLGYGGPPLNGVAQLIERRSCVWVHMRTLLTRAHIVGGGRRRPTPLAPCIGNARRFL